MKKIPEIRLQFIFYDTNKRPEYKAPSALKTVSAEQSSNKGKIKIPKKNVAVKKNLSSEL